MLVEVSMLILIDQVFRMESPDSNAN
jgi:hypothetical protein